MSVQISAFRCSLVISLVFDPRVVLGDSGEDRWFVGIAPPAAPCDHAKQEVGVPSPTEQRSSGIALQRQVLVLHSSASEQNWS